jgi:hypothetical protein
VRRRVLNLLAGLSLRVCVAAVVLLVLTGVRPFVQTFTRSRPLFNEVPEGEK